MVCIANYNDKQEVIGCKREDGVSGGLDFLADCEALGMAITYKTQAELKAELLEQAKASKKLDLKATFTEACKEPVLYNDVNYHGGEDSAMKLDGKRRMIEAAGGISVDYFDVNDGVVSHTLEEAMQVCLAVANDYETKLADYKAKCKLVYSATTVAEMEVTNG